MLYVDVTPTSWKPSPLHSRVSSATWYATLIQQLFSQSTPIAKVPAIMPCTGPPTPGPPPRIFSFIYSGLYHPPKTTFAGHRDTPNVEHVTSRDGRISNAVTRSQTSLPLPPLRQSRDATSQSRLVNSCFSFNSTRPGILLTVIFRFSPPPLNQCNSPTTKPIYVFGTRRVRHEANRRYGPPSVSPARVFGLTQCKPLILSAHALPNSPTTGTFTAPNGPSLQRSATLSRPPAPCAAKTTLDIICYVAASTLPSVRCATPPLYASQLLSLHYPHIRTLIRAPQLTAHSLTHSPFSNLTWYGPEL